MERVEFRNSRGLKLVGNLYSKNSNSVIIMSHGFTGDKSEHGKFPQTAKILSASGYNVLSFDFSGSGESDDDSLTVDKQVDDLKSAINFVLAGGMNNIGLLGLSLGGLISAKVYDKRIKVMVFWAPVTDKVKYSWRFRYLRKQIKELKEKGYLTLVKDTEIRRKIIIDKQMLKDRKNINQKQLLSRIKCPVLIIHGDEDDKVPLRDSKNALQYLSDDSKLEIIKGGDHKLDNFMDQVIPLSANWFKKYL